MMSLIIGLSFLGMIAGCSSGGSSNTQAISTNQTSGSIAVQLAWNNAKSTAKSVASAPVSLATVRIIISAADIPAAALQKDFPASQGAGTLDGVPAGSGRTVVAQGLDASGTVAYQGVASNIVVQAGKTTDAGTITMSPVATTAFNGTIVLGSPTASSIKANIFSADQSGTVLLKYGTSPGVNDKQTTAEFLVAGKPVILTMGGLAAGTRYYYRLFFQTSGGSAFSQSDEYSFHSARSTGSSYTFTIQADSHLDENSDPEMYRKTLANIRADAPDFHIDLGDTFMCEKHSAPLTATVQTAPDQATVDARYAYERAYFGLVTHSVPLFLVNGNHEGELGWLRGATAMNTAIWTTLARQNYYMNPVPDTFYSGDSTLEPFVGKRASWYAWNWGDALFIVLDPYWNSMTSASKDPWAMTLGKTQYDWLQQTLSTSTATFKFVFIHNLVGGLDGQMRGGVEAAPYFEWGGKNLDGTDVFALKRPGWSMPIHQLLVANGVSAVFHGHDHIYAKQVLDGVVYQEVPQPSSLNSQSGAILATQYHYAAGTILSSSGYIRVTVGPGQAKVEYVRSWLPKNETAIIKNGQVDDTWSITTP